tara:strand:+ start:889 stop:1293 length:405 start_codon:yes stop_codon:yes gene_type:complete
MCFNSSSSSAQASETTDERVGADNGSTAFRAVGENSIVVGSDDVASIAILAAQEALKTSTDFITDNFTNILNSADRRADKADANSAATQAFAADIVSQAQETSDERIIGMVKILLLSGVAVVAFQSGAFKGIFK